MFLKEHRIGIKLGNWMQTTKMKKKLTQRDNGIVINTPIDFYLPSPTTFFDKHVPVDYALITAQLTPVSLLFFFTTYTTVKHYKHFTPLSDTDHCRH